jgi:hypothetical protein
MWQYPRALGPRPYLVCTESCASELMGDPYIDTGRESSALGEGTIAHGKTQEPLEESVIGFVDGWLSGRVRLRVR